MNATINIANYQAKTGAIDAFDTQSALRFITCGSVDDGKSTLIGRLLVDSRSVLQDQLASVSKSGTADLALFTDGLSAEREQGITIDVAWRYFNTAQRKFIIGDAPGHEQYTRNMVTAASNADAAVVLVDATKLPWASDANAAAPDASEGWGLLPQTRRHTLLLNLLRVPGIVFAVNKLDAFGASVATQAFARISTALQAFAAKAGLTVAATVPISALLGHNVVQANPGWCGYQGQSLLHILEALPTTPSETQGALAFPVQWVEKFSASSDTLHGRRIFWGRVATGVARVGQRLSVLPSGQTATIAQVFDRARAPGDVEAGQSAGLVLDRELDVSRGDWLRASGDGVDAIPITKPQSELVATVAWMDDVPLAPGRTYWALHGHTWVKARVTHIDHSLNINTLQPQEALTLGANAIGQIRLSFQTALPVQPFSQSRKLGSLVLVDTATHRTAGAVLVQR
jgi:sulfate adenylyltransferase subunit 1